MKFRVASFLQYPRKICSEAATRHLPTYLGVAELFIIKDGNAGILQRN